MKIPNKKYNIKTAVKNNFYMLKLAMELCPGRFCVPGWSVFQAIFPGCFSAAFF